MDIANSYNTVDALWTLPSTATTFIMALLGTAMADRKIRQRKKRTVNGWHLFLLLLTSSLPLLEANQTIFIHKANIAESFSLAHIRIDFDFGPLFSQMQLPCSCASQLHKHTTTDQHLQFLQPSISSLNQLCEASRAIIRTITQTITDLTGTQFLRTFHNSRAIRAIVTTLAIAVAVPLLMAGGYLVHDAINGLLGDDDVWEQVDRIDSDLELAATDMKIVTGALTDVSEISIAHTRIQAAQSAQATCFRQANTARIVSMTAQDYLTALTTGKATAGIVSSAFLQQPLLALRAKAHRKGLTIPLTTPGQLIGLPLSFSVHHGKIILMIHVPMYTETLALVQYVNFPLIDRHGHPHLIQTRDTSGVRINNRTIAAPPDLTQCLDISNTYFCPFYNAHSQAPQLCLSALYSANENQINANCAEQRINTTKFHYAQISSNNFKLYSQTNTNVTIICDGAHIRTFNFTGFYSLGVGSDCLAKIGNATLLPLSQQNFFQGLRITSLAVNETLFLNNTQEYIASLHSMIHNLEQVQNIHANPLNPLSHLFHLSTGFLLLLILGAITIVCAFLYYVKKMKLYYKKNIPTSMVFDQQSFNQMCQAYSQHHPGQTIV